jgi:hypothetical protein
MYKYQSKNDDVKLNSALKNTYTNLKFGTVTCKFMCNIQDRRNLLVTLNLKSNVSPHTEEYHGTLASTMYK